MRIRELVAVLALAAVTTACVDNPDPRRPTLKKMETEGVGAWIVASSRQGLILEGELISATQEYVHILRVGQAGAPLVYLRSGDVASARLYKYESEAIGGLGLLGTLSTISHGFFLVLTAPIWMITSGVAASYESKHVLLEYPEEVSIDELSDWARFPQGIPPTVDEEALLVPRANRRKPVIVPPPVVPAPITPPSATPPQPAPSNPAAMFMDAKAAAARNDCALVLELSGKVQLADQAYYDAVFSKEPSIRLCLGL